MVKVSMHASDSYPPPHSLGAVHGSLQPATPLTACCALHTGAGFFIGDGAGVGKGRQIAGVIIDNYVRGRRCVWGGGGGKGAIITFVFHPFTFLAKMVSEYQ